MATSPLPAYGGIGMRRLIPVLMAMMTVAAVAYPQGINNNEVKFTGAITAALPNGEGLGTLFVAIDTVNLRVLVNPDTEIRGSGDLSLTMDQLAEKVRIAAEEAPPGEVLVEVAGKFSSSGILANGITLLDSGSKEFDVRGHITQAAPSGDDMLVSLLGLTILVPSALHIQSDGAEVPIASLATGMRIHVAGTISDAAVWTADLLEVLAKGKKQGMVSFEGIVVSYESGLLKVAVNGATGNVTSVNITPETEVAGDPGAGAYVEVKGIMVDLTVKAREVQVIAPLEVKPEVRKLKVGETGTFTVKLRETAASDVPVALTITSGATSVKLPEESVVVPKGSRTVDFAVEAQAVGTAVIKADALGGSASAAVTVGQVSETDNERPDGTVRIVFSPDHIKMDTEDTRDVVLLIQPPQDTIPTLDIKTGGIVTVTVDRNLGQGVASMKVRITSGTSTGTDTVVVTLPASPDSGQAELLVEVQSKVKK